MASHSLKGVVNGSEGRLPRRKLGFEKRQIGSIRQRIADLGWLLSRSFGTTYAGDIMAVNLKNLDFSLLSDFLVGTGDLLVFYAGLQPATGLHDRRNDDVSVGQVERIGI